MFKKATPVNFFKRNDPNNYFYLNTSIQMKIVCSFISDIKRWKFRLKVVRFYIYYITANAINSRRTNLFCNHSLDRIYPK